MKNLSQANERERKEAPEVRALHQEYVQVRYGGAYLVVSAGAFPPAARAPRRFRVPKLAVAARRAVPPTSTAQLSPRTSADDNGAEPPSGCQYAPTGALVLHPSADLVPEMPAAEYQPLKRDIGENGIKEPIRVLRNTNMVLDGRHRRRAAIELGLKTVPVLEVDLGEQTPEQYMVRTALLRRHLTDDQRAMMAAMLAKRGGAL